MQTELLRKNFIRLTGASGGAILLTNCSGGVASFFGKQTDPNTGQEFGGMTPNDGSPPSTIQATYGKQVFTVKVSGTTLTATSTDQNGNGSYHIGSVTVDQNAGKVTLTPAGSSPFIFEPSKWDGRSPINAFGGTAQMTAQTTGKYSISGKSGTYNRDIPSSKLTGSYDGNYASRRIGFHQPPKMPDCQHIQCPDGIMFYTGGDVSGVLSIILGIVGFAFAGVFTPEVGLAIFVVALALGILSVFSDLPN